MKRTIILFTLSVLTTLAGWSQASFNIMPPRNVVAGQQFRVVYRLSNGEGSSLKAPEIQGCRLLYGPATSTSSSTQIINGNVTSSYTVDYNYTYVADKEGDYTIPEASIVVDGKKLVAPAKQFKVIAADKNAGNQRGNNQGGMYDGYESTTPSQSISKDDIFVRVILNKTNVYEQEAVECVLKLYTKYESITSFSQSNPSDYDGFLIDEVQVQPQLNDIENFNGQVYRTAILKRAILFPQKSGKLTVSSGAYDVTVQQNERISNGFFYMVRPVERNVKLHAYTATLNVKPLPQPAPAAFNGAVGKFNMTSRLSSDALRTGEAASLTITVNGTGNIKYLKQPVVQFPPEFEQYTPKQEFDTHPAGSNVTGKMTVEYTFVPESVGKFDIRPVEFVYFDPATGEYVTQTTPEYTINVAKGVGGSSNTIEQQNIKLKNSDILHINLGDKHLQKTHNYLGSSLIYWLVYPALLLIFIAVCIVMNKRIKRNADVAGRKVARASKVARKRLSLAEKAMKSGKKEEFYDAILKAIWGYLSDKLAIPVSGLTRSNISEELERYGAPAEAADKVIRILDDCEMARYTPDDASLTPAAIYAAAEEAMNELETVKKRKA